MSQPIVLDDTTSRLTTRLMAAVQERQRVLSHNIANANIPGYIRHGLDFRTELINAMEESDPAAISKTQFDIVKDHSQVPGEDGNNVSLPSEMNKLMQNGIMYNLLAKAFNTRINILKSGINR